MDRIDMILEVPRISIDTLLDIDAGESSQKMKAKVIKAWEIQQERYKGTSISTNAHLDSKHIQKFITLNDQAKKFIKDAVRKLNLSPRVVHRMYKLARSIADMN